MTEVTEEVIVDPFPLCRRGGAQDSVCILPREHWLQNVPHCEYGWVLRLPFTKAMTLNDRQSHWAKAASVKPWRQAAATHAAQSRVPRLLRVRIELHYVPKDKRRRDPLNLVAALKPIEDGIVDAGVVPDDTTEFVDPTMPRIHPPAPLAGGRFWVFVVELAPLEPVVVQVCPVHHSKTRACGCP